MRLSSLRASALAFAGLLFFVTTATAAEVRVMISGGLTAAYKVLVPEFERATGHTIVTAYGPSMGTTVNAIPVRLERGEPADVLIMVGYALKDLADKGKVIPDSRIDLVKSPIGVAVKAGAPKPDISTADALKRTLLAAKTIAYSDSASGVYVSTEMFQKLGIADEMKDRARKIPATPVGEIVAQQRGHVLETDILVVAGLRFGRRREDGFRQFVAFPQPGRQFDPADCAVRLVLLPTGARDVSAGDAFHLDHVGALHEHGAPLQLIGKRMELRWVLREIGCQKVSRDEVTQKIKPKNGKLRENPSLVGDAGGEHVIERRNAIGGNDQELIADAVYVADFAARVERNALQICL